MSIVWHAGLAYAEDVITVREVSYWAALYV